MSKCPHFVKKNILVLALNCVLNTHPTPTPTHPHPHPPHTTPPQTHKHCFLVATNSFTIGKIIKTYWPPGVTLFVYKGSQQPKRKNKVDSIGPICPHHKSYRAEAVDLFLSFKIAIFSNILYGMQIALRNNLNARC